MGDGVERGTSSTERDTQRETCEYSNRHRSVDIHQTAWGLGNGLLRLFCRSRYTIVLPWAAPLLAFWLVSRGRSPLHFHAFVQLLLVVLATIASSILAATPVDSAWAPLLVVGVVYPLLKQFCSAVGRGSCRHATAAAAQEGRPALAPAFTTWYLMALAFALRSYVARTNVFLLPSLVALSGTVEAACRTQGPQFRALCLRLATACGFQHPPPGPLGAPATPPPPPPPQVGTVAAVPTPPAPASPDSAPSPCSWARSAWEHPKPWERRRGRLPLRAPASGSPRARARSHSPWTMARPPPPPARGRSASPQGPRMWQDRPPSATGESTSSGDALLVHGPGADLRPKLLEGDIEASVVELGEPSGSWVGGPGEGAAARDRFFCEHLLLEIVAEYTAILGSHLLPFLYQDRLLQVSCVSPVGDGVE